MQLDIAYDAFVRTTDAKHEALVCDVLDKVWAKGDIYMADYQGWCALNLDVITNRM